MLNLESTPDLYDDRTQCSTPSVHQANRRASYCDCKKMITKKSNSILHVSMVAKFLADKFHDASNFIDLIPYHFILQMLTKFSRFEISRGGGVRVRVEKELVSEGVGGCSERILSESTR